MKDRLPEWAQDALITTVRVRLDWRDRLKVLFGQTLELRIETACETRPGRVESETTVSVYRPRRRSLVIGFMPETEK